MNFENMPNFNALAGHDDENMITETNNNNPPIPNPAPVYNPSGMNVDKQQMDQALRIVQQMMAQNWKF